MKHIVIGHLGYIAPEGCSLQALAHRAGVGEHAIEEFVKPMIEAGEVVLRDGLYHIGDGKAEAAPEPEHAVEPEPKPKSKGKRGKG